MFELVSIAEGYNNELFLYVFTPCPIEDYYLCKLSMYITQDPNQRYIDSQNYKLKCVSTDGKFQKYLVENYTVATGEVYRYYNIVGISRPFYNDLDTNIENGYTNDIDISVGQQWCVYKLNNSLVYEKGSLKVLYLKTIYNGHFTLENGYSLKNLWLGEKDRKDLHFVAFNPYIINSSSGDKEEVDMDHIVNADIEYYLKEVYKIDYPDDTALFDFPDDLNFYLNDGKEIYKNETLYDSDYITYDGEGIFKKSYEWNRIYKSSDFLDHFKNDEGVDILLDAESKINSSEWVFAFTDTDNIKSNLNLGHYKSMYGEDYVTDNALYISSILDHNKKSTVEEMYECSKVDVLRIEFLDTSGNVYNLGVVMDATTQDLIADGFGNPILDYTELLEKILAIISIVIILIIGFYIFPILKIIGKVFMYILNGIWIIISFPFKIFKKNDKYKR